MPGLQDQIVQPYLQRPEFLQVLGPYGESAQPFARRSRADTAVMEAIITGVGGVHKASDSDSKQALGSEFPTMFSRIY